MKNEVSVLFIVEMMLVKPGELPKEFLGEKNMASFPKIGHIFNEQTSCKQQFKEFVLYGCGQGCGYSLAWCMGVALVPEKLKPMCYWQPSACSGFLY